ncbi:TrkA-C domain protein [Magnetospirillum sp. SS-4]|nr:TrkA-C domain protein [Magnetospirillum sp. SS-4]
MVLVLVALVLFTRKRIPLETSSLAILALLVMGFELFPYVGRDGTAIHAVDFLHGFGHEALISVCALMVAGQGIVRTGALEPIGRSLSRLWSFSPKLSLLLTLLVGASLSAFVNNVPVVVLLMPILISISLRTGNAASGILMPMGFATLVGGMTTTIGTSTNLLVVSIAADMGLRRLAVFDFFLPAALIGGLAVIYLWLAAPLLLPRRQAPLADTSPRLFSGDLRVEAGGYADGKTLSEVIAKTGGHLRIIEFRRPSGLSMAPLPDAVLRGGDRLEVRDTPQNLKEFEEAIGARLYTGNHPVDDDHPLSAEDQQIAEIVVTQGCPLDGSTLSRARFADIYKLVTLALHRAGSTVRTFREGISDIRLGIGDVLLVQGPSDQISAMKKAGDFLVLDATADLPRTRKAPVAIAIMVGVVLAAATGVLPIAIGAVCGVLAMLLTRCISWRDGTRALSVSVIMIVVASLALGTALVKTGGADYLARLFVAAAAGGSPGVALSGLMLVMAILTNIVSNNAAAVIGTPVAMGIATQMNLPAEPFVLAVLFGANMSYATPMAYKTNLLVMNAGGYSFGDFVRVGGPLTVMMWLGLSWLLPRLYGL